MAENAVHPRYRVNESPIPGKFGVFDTMTQEWARFHKNGDTVHMDMTYEEAAAEMVRFNDEQDDDGIDPILATNDLADH